MARSAALTCLAVAAAFLAGCRHNDNQSSGGSTVSAIKPPPPPPPPAGALVALGQALFHDKVISGNKNIACNTCHSVGAGSSDALPVSIGEGGIGVAASRSLGQGQTIPRNSQALFNNAVTSQNTGGLVFQTAGGAPVMMQQPTTFANLQAGAAAAPVASPPAVGTFAAGAAAPGGDSYGGVSETLFWDARVQFNPFLSPDTNLNTGSDPTITAMRAVIDSPLAIQALFPVVTPAEMQGQPGTNELANAPDDETVWKLLMVRLVGTKNGTVGGIQGYRDLFAAAYPGVSFDALTFAHATRGIAAYVAATFTATDTPFDTFVAGDPTALTAQQQNGMNLFFGTAGCASCHSGLFFSDFTPHALAVPQVGPGKNAPFEDLGFALTSGNASDNYTFVTPSLRNVALTGPYMHDGCYTTLEAVVMQHNDPATALATYDPTQLPPLFQGTFDTDPTRNAARIAAIDPLLQNQSPLAASDVADIVAFLQALTDPQSMTRAQAAKPTSVPSGLPID
jgi:cytochrome c peroxidase